MAERKIVVPGESIISGEDYLPGNGTRREDEDIIASKFGLVDISDRLIKVIPLSGRYVPRRGNTIIGQIVDYNMKGWMIDFGNTSKGFLPVSEVPWYINKNELLEHFDFGDVIVAKVDSVGGRGIDLTIKVKGCGKVEEGILIDINPHKVPRVIGKEGSMITTVKEMSGCTITVGQNGVIWLKGDDIESELKAKKIIEFISENSYVDGLTEKVKEFAEGLGKSKSKKTEKAEESEEKPAKKEKI